MNIKWLFGLIGFFCVTPAYSAVVLDTLSFNYADGSSFSVVFTDVEYIDGQHWISGPDKLTAISNVSMFDAESGVGGNAVIEIGGSTFISFTVTGNSIQLDAFDWVPILDDPSVPFLDYYLSYEPDALYRRRITGALYNSTPIETSDFTFTSEVPLPASAWLFGSALLGLLRPKK